MNHIKVYKSDVDDWEKARLIQQAIQNRFKNHEVSFDLEDVDNVLRVENPEGPVNESALTYLIENYGHHIERLP